MLINVIVQLMNALNFGVGDSTIKEVSYNQAQSNIEKVNTSFNYNLSLSIVLMLLASGIGVVLAQIILQYNLFSIASNIKQEAFWAIVLFSVSTGLKFIEQVFLSLFKGLQRFDNSSKLNMLSRISVLVSTIIVVYNGFGILQIIKTTLIVNIVNLTIQAFIILKHTPIKSIFPKFNRKDNIQISQNNIWFWLQSVIALFGFLSDRLIIGQLSDLKTVGYYSIAALVGSQIQNVLLAFGSIVFPKVSADNALNKNSIQIYYVSRFLIAGLGWFIIGFLLLFGQYIFKWWLGTEVFSQAFYFIKLYLAFVAIILLMIVPYYFINGSNHLKLNSLFELVLRVTHIVAMYISYKYFGTEGLLWALILVTALNIPFQYFIFNKFILQQKGLFLAVLPLFPSLCIIGLAVSTSWVLSLVLVIIFLVLFWFIYFNKVKPVFLKLIFKNNE